MRNIIIGDVHGCLNELKNLLNEMEYNPEDDRLIFVGDLIDRGPYSIETVQYIRDLSGRYDVIAIMGNHEEKYVRYRHWMKENKETGKTIPMHLPEIKKMIYNGLSETDHLWLSERPYYYFSKDFLVVHAGVCRRRHLKLQDLNNKKYLNRLYSLRKIDSKGRMLSYNSPTVDNERYWSNDYDGRFGIVIYGHDAQTMVRISPHAYGIDTGCCFGGTLTALIFNENKKIERVSVEAEQTYRPRWEVER